MEERRRLAAFIQVAVKDHLARRSKRWLHLPNEFMFLIESTTRLATGSLSVHPACNCWIRILDTCLQRDHLPGPLSALGHLFPYTRFFYLSFHQTLDELEYCRPSIWYNFNHCPINWFGRNDFYATILNEILLIRRTSRKIKFESLIYSGQILEECRLNRVKKKWW